MVCSAVFLTDLKGKVIISRNYRGDVPLSSCENFSKYINETDELDRQPIFTQNGYTYCYVRPSSSNLYLMAVTKRNSNVVLMLTFLGRLVGVFKDYFGELEEER